MRNLAGVVYFMLISMEFFSGKSCLHALWKTLEVWNLVIYFVRVFFFLQGFLLSTRFEWQGFLPYASFFFLLAKSSLSNKVLFQWQSLLSALGPSSNGNVFFQRLGVFFLSGRSSSCSKVNFQRQYFLLAATSSSCKVYFQRQCFLLASRFSSIGKAYFQRQGFLLSTRSSSS